MGTPEKLLGRFLNKTCTHKYRLGEASDPDACKTMVQDKSKSSPETCPVVRYIALQSDETLGGSDAQFCYCCSELVITSVSEPET